MPTKLPERYQCCERRTEAISLLTAWVRQLKPFGRCPQLVLTARLASKAIEWRTCSTCPQTVHRLLRHGNFTRVPTFSSCLQSSTRLSTRLRKRSIRKTSL